jgi:MbtH protein
MDSREQSRCPTLAVFPAAQREAARPVSDSEMAYKVVVDHDRRDVPAGWRDEGVAGSREECLAHIETVWTDMRPLSLRARSGG